MEDPSRGYPMNHLKTSVLDHLVQTTAGTAVHALQDFLEYLKGERALSPATLRGYGTDLAQWFLFLKEALGRNRLDVEDLSEANLRRFIFHRHPRLAKSSQARALATYRSFFRFLTQRRAVEGNPARSLRSPKVSITLPIFLDVDDMLSFLNGLEAKARAASAPWTVARDWAIFETLLDSICGLMQDKSPGFAWGHRD